MGIVSEVDKWEEEIGKEVWKEDIISVVIAKAWKLTTRLNEEIIGPSKGLYGSGRRYFCKRARQEKNLMICLFNWETYAYLSLWTQSNYYVC